MRAAVLFAAVVFPVLQFCVKAASPVKKISMLTDHAGRVDWGPHNVLAIDAMGSNGTYDVYLLNVDGTNRRCLTCGHAELPPGNRGNPAWHPTGDYIVFQAADPIPAMVPERMRAKIQFVTAPGAGIHNNLWLTDAKGEQFWTLTQTGRGGGVLHPAFSPDGRKLFWSEHIGKGNGRTAGVWELKLADFTMADGAPRLSNIRSFQPVFKEGAYESHSVMPGNQKLLFTSNPQTGVTTGSDIYLFDLKTRELTNLTKSPDVWDEHAHISPSGRHIIWMSSRGFPLPGSIQTALSLETEYWLMNADGTNQQQLTHFNKPGVPRTATEGGAAADVAWSPDGRAAVGFSKRTHGRVRGGCT